MNIRPARSIDAPILADILQERFDETRYVGVCNIEPVLARRLFAQGAQRHGGTNDGATFLMVAEHDGEVVAFLLGALARIYLVGDRLGASDQFLLSRNKVPAGVAARATMRLLDAYIDWADNNPKVCEIALSWADTLPDTEGITRLFEKRGFILYHKSFRRDTRFKYPAKEAAAA